MSESEIEGKVNLSVRQKVFWFEKLNVCAHRVMAWGHVGGLRRLWVEALQASPLHLV